MLKKLHSFRCTEALWDAITAHADSAKLSANEAMEQMIEEALGLSAPVVKSSPIADLEARVRVLEEAIAKPDSKLDSKPIAVTPAQPKAIALADDDWLTTGEAHQLMQERYGYRSSATTLRRHLREAQAKQEVGQELGRWGIVELNFQEREAANPKSNAVRWIKIGD